MTNKYIADEIAALPKPQQREVLEFVVFLRNRYAGKINGRVAEKTSISQEPFIGMWAGRDDMNDSSAWIHAIRRGEWERTDVDRQRHSD